MGITNPAGRFLAAVLIFLAAPYLGICQLIELPPDLGTISWTTTPDMAASDNSKQPAVVWLGSVEGVTATPGTGQVQVEWLCRHLQIVSPGETAIAKKPVRFTSSEGGFFLVSLVIQVPPEAAEMLQQQFEGAGRYVLAAGHAGAVVGRDGRQAVFLDTAKMLQADDIAEPAGR